MFRNFFERRAEMFGGVGRALSHRNYRRYAMGHVAHVHGWWGNGLGLGWLTWELTGSASWLGTITIANLVPVMLISPLTGAIADRYGHRRTAMTAALCGSAITFTICGLIFTGHITLTSLVTLTILQGLVFGLEFPARQALIPQLVGRPNIPAAVAFNSTTFQLGAFLGPVIAASLISAFNTGAAIMMYACTTLWMAAMIYSIDVESPARSDDGGRGGLLTDIRAGFSYAWDEKALILLFLITVIHGFFLRSYVYLLPGFADEVFNRGAEGLGALNAASGLGALFVALWMMVRGGTRGLVAVMVASSFITALSLVGFAVMPGFFIAVSVLAIVAGALLAAQVSSYSLIQTLARPDMRGRVISLNIAFIMGGPALGAQAIGWVADRVGLPMAVAGASVIAGVLFVLITPAIRRRRAAMEAEPSSPT